MKISTLFRTPFRSDLLARRWKPRITEDTLFERKEAKRLRNTNTLDNDHTNEKVMELLTPKRVKTIGQLYEKRANMNPQFAKIEPAVKEQLRKVFP